MKVVDIRTDIFFHTSYRSQDSGGHSHPGPGKRVKHALLRIVADDGTEGYSFQHPEQLSAAILDSYVRPVLAGQDPLARERLFDEMVHRQRGSGGRFNDRSLSAVDQALWDLAGRKAGMPVYKLIGAYRDKILAYGSIMCGDDLPGGLSSPEDYAAYSVKLVERGYRAVKLHTWFPPMPGAPDPKMEIAACAAVREAVGPDIRLMLDGYHWYSRTDALRIGRALEKLDFEWFEEPMDETSMSSYAWLADKLDIPVLGPETISGKNRSRAEWVRHEASDILRTGVLNAGGITPSLKVMHTAHSFGLNCEVHGNGAANLALCLSSANCDWYERGLLHPFLDYEQPPEYLRGIVDPMDGEGYVHGSAQPGLGEDIDFEYIEANLAR
ncbi:enolase C-terminal domain-like protein [Neorhizobium sp. DT-125]|uniref:enolase C-terminal domain-like protein n=1 Tax=Neorhizobium sp. DT-125 TaxID=3396163 RepID=UPI003F199502